jgi:hypothetical protein
MSGKVGKNLIFETKGQISASHSIQEGLVHFHRAGLPSYSPIATDFIDYVERVIDYYMEKIEFSKNRSPLLQSNNL